MKKLIKLGLLALGVATLLGACGDPPTVSGPQGSPNAEGEKKAVNSETGDRA